MFKNYLTESLIYNKEDNPLYYIFIIPALVKSDVESTKNNLELFNLLNLINEEFKGINTNSLKKVLSPIHYFDFFSTESVKKDIKIYIEQTFREFEIQIAFEEKDFSKSYKVNKAFTNVLKSDEYKKFINTI